MYKIYQFNPVKVFAQWEIASFLVSKYQMNSTNLQSIEPIIASDGTITYQSTAGVAAAIVALEGTAAAMGTVAVVAHRDHAKRCIETSVAVGMNAFAVEGGTLPVNYDPLSGQPWTRNRELYVFYDCTPRYGPKSERSLPKRTPTAKTHLPFLKHPIKSCQHAANFSFPHQPQQRYPPLQQH